MDLNAVVLLPSLMYNFPSWVVKKCIDDGGNDLTASTPWPCLVAIGLRPRGICFYPIAPDRCVEVEIKRIVSVFVFKYPALRSRDDQAYLLLP